MGRIEHTLLDEGRASSPTDLRPSPATPPYHTKLQMFLSTTEDRDTPRHGAELLRITLPRTPVNSVHSGRPISGKKSAHSVPLPVYSAPGACRKPRVVAHNA